MRNVLHVTQPELSAATAAAASPATVSGGAAVPVWPAKQWAQCRSRSGCGVAEINTKSTLTVNCN